LKALKVIVPVALVLGALAVGGLIVRSGIKSLDEPLQLSAPLVYNIAPRTRFAHVAADLAGRGLLRQPRAFVLYARYKGLASAIKAGEYEIEPGATPRSLLEKFVSGQVLLHSFTIVDGWRVADMLAALKKNSDITVTLPDPPKDLMQKLGAPGLDPEGQFLPETYRFPLGTSDLDLLRQAHAALVRELDAAWADRDPSIPLHDREELLTAASIVQKESGVPEELSKIAGLYLHRLKIGMKLQADPTVIYGLGDRYDGDLHSVDLHTDGPYNTYTRTGLPPTPIALVSAAVLRATAHPADTDALYFVASTKDDGSHVFSATLEQQNAAVARYVAHQREKAASR
jgi:UPF0755 protein